MRKKTTGRLIAAAVCAIMCIASCLTAFAAGEPVTIKECDGLQLTLPDNMSAITRSTPSDDSFFSRHSLDYYKVMRDFTDGDIYLQAMDNENNITLTLSYVDTDHKDFSELTQSDLSQVARNFINESGDARYNSATQDEAGKPVVWLFFNMTAMDQEGKTFHQYQATTVHDGKNVNLTLCRNSGDVEYIDYHVLSQIASSVQFPPKQDNSFANNLNLLIIIGAAILIAIIIMIIIIVIVKKTKRRKKTVKNNKILEELADKYQSHPNYNSYREESEPEQATADYAQVYSEDESETANIYSYGDEMHLPQQTLQPSQTIADDYESGYNSYSRHDDYDGGYDGDEPKRKYSDADIARLLGDVEDDENFIDTLPATEADFAPVAEVRDSVSEKAEPVSEYIADAPAAETETAALPAAEENAASAYISVQENAVQHVEEALPQKPEDPEETPAQHEAEIPGEAPENAAPESDIEDDGEGLPSETESDGGETGEENGADNDEDEDFEDYANDEVLVREASKQDKFKSSNDFFEEAPLRVLGIFSSRDIDDAEEYDVIGEEEHRAEEIEKEAEPPEKKSFSKSINKVFDGIKSFFRHCGYFATNIKREIKRKRAKKKRKKAEEERRRKQAEQRRNERASQKSRRTESGLVQVHSRSDKKR